MAGDLAFDRFQFSRYTFVNLYGRAIRLIGEGGKTLATFKNDGHAHVTPEPTKRSVFGVPMVAPAQVVGLPRRASMTVVIVDSEVAEHLRKNPSEYLGSVITPCPRTRMAENEEDHTQVTRFVIVSNGFTV